MTKLMTLTNKDIKKIAKLARIEVTSEEEGKFLTQLNNIFQWIDQLKEVNVENIPEMAGVGGYTMRMRAADEVTEGNIRDAILANAPKAQFGCFVVPKVVDAG
jgi:aspartyl-tRNA(Asn)/glutamyl-tRNA(Gln) amidotransferase subunit C